VTFDSSAELVIYKPLLMSDPVNIVTVFDLIGFIASLASLALSIIAIWLTLHFKKEADGVNKDTRNLLIDVKTDAKALTSVAENAMGELTKYGDTSRELTRQIVTGRIASASTTDLTTSPPTTVPSVEVPNLLKPTNRLVMPD
jgi:hypothetical protein